jgi:hypothetical protein
MHRGLLITRSYPNSRVGAYLSSQVGSVRRSGRFSSFAVKMFPKHVSLLDADPYVEHSLASYTYTEFIAARGLLTE